MKKAISILITLLIAGGVYYITSDVGRERLREQFKQYAYWTPENIVKYPLEYLNFCESEAQEGLEKLKANQISVSQNLTQLTSRKNERDSSIRTVDASLTELRSLYNGSDTKWPVQWLGKSLDESTYKSQVVQFSRDIELWRKLSAQYASAIHALESQPGKIREAIATLNGQLAEIKVQREILKIQKINEKLAEQFLNIKVALQGTSSIISDSGSASIMTGDQLVQQSVNAGPSDDEFRRALGM